MKQIVCDRCGELTKTGTYVKFERTRKLIPEDMDFIRIIDKKEFELCEQCNGDFDRFIEQGIIEKSRLRGE